jgi:hypothetical protein
VSDGGPWQPPDPNAAPAYPSVPTVELEQTSPPAPARKRSPGVIIAATVGGAAVIGAAVFGVTRLVSESGGGGAATPEEAGLALLTAMENEDVLGVMDVLLPGERETLKDPLVELTDELSRVEVLSADASLSDVAGVDIELQDERVEVEETNVDDIVNLQISARGSGTIDGEQLPIGDLVADNLPDDADLSELDASGEADQEELETLPITAVEQDGRWYLSVFHSVAEQARGTAEEPVDIPAEGVTPVGGDSPEDAVDAFLGGVQDLDLETIIASLNPDEFQALQRYAPIFLDDAQADLDQAVADEGVTVEIADPEYSVSGSGDTRSLSIDYLRIDVTAQEETVNVEYEDGCWKVSGGGENVNSCDLAGDTSTLEEMFDDPEPVQNLLATVQEAFSEYESPGFIVKRVEGQWYLSPVATLSEQLLAALRALDRDEIETIGEQASDAFESGFNSEAAGDTIFGNFLAPGNDDFSSDAESFLEDDGGQVESQVGVGLAQASCEEPASTDVGTTFACTAVGDDGQTYEFTVEITGDNEYQVSGGTPAD